jgi:hypothetical protein
MQPERRGAALATKTVENLNNVIEVTKNIKSSTALALAYATSFTSSEKYRYKVHIQTDVGIEMISRDENAAFSATIVGWSLALT